MVDGQVHWRFAELIGERIWFGSVWSFGIIWNVFITSFLILSIFELKQVYTAFFTKFGNSQFIFLRIEEEPE